MPSDVPGLDREFDNEKRRVLVQTEVALRARIAAERDKVLLLDPRPTNYTKFIDGRVADATRNDDVKLLP
jgi:hypothetical protein